MPKYICKTCGDEFSHHKERKQCFKCLPLKKRKELTEQEKLEKKKEKGRQSVKKRRKKIKEMAIEYKGGKCQRCGYDKYIGALEFHHIDEKEKDFGISDGKTRSWESIKEELDKCILVCSNCHREIHAEIRNKNKINRDSSIGS